MVLSRFPLRSFCNYDISIANREERGCLRSDVHLSPDGSTAVLNAANEEAVAAFLAGEIRFPDIVALVESALGAFEGGGASLEEIIEADRLARTHVRARIGKVKA